MYAEDDEDPPCKTCYPGVHEWNEDAYQVWSLAKGQWRYSFGGEERLDICAVESAMRILGAEDDEKPGLAHKVMLMGDTILGEIRDQRYRDEQQNGG